MKRILLFIVIVFPALVYAQDIILFKRKLSYSLSEKYYALKTDKKVKQGAYEVYSDNDNLIARGHYNNGAKEGIWEYYNEKGLMIQKYDYTNGLLIHFNQDTTSMVKSSYILLQTPGKEDVIDVPYKIGGDFFGLGLLYDQKKIPQDFINDKLDVVMAYILTISETGKLESWKTLYKSDYYNKEINESIRNLPSDAYEFSPAKLNDKPVKSKIIYTTKLNYNIMEVPRTNNIITQKN